MHPTVARALFLPSLLCEITAACVTARRWWDEIDDGLIVGALPFRRHVSRLYELGVRRVVNLCGEHAGPRAAYRYYGIEQLHLPTPDFTPPTFDVVARALDFLDDARVAGHGAYLHCKAGRGRSATVAVCRLMQLHGLTASEAEARLRRIRPHIDRGLARRAVVAEFAERFAMVS